MLLTLAAASLAFSAPPRSRVLRMSATPATTASPPAPLVWTEQPQNVWQWKEGWDGATDLSIHYVAAGAPDAPPMLLIHGFGASAFHWRRNVNVLADAGYRVYAIDLVGFGLSSKPVIDYDSTMWREQCAAFMREVAACGVDGRRAIVAGNSIGGNAALAVGAEYPELVCGVASLNGAGRYSPSAEEARALAEAEEARRQRGAVRVALDDALDRLAASVQRAAAYVGLFVTKTPLRIKQVLRQVYPVNPEAADDELVASIVYPAEDALGLAPPGQIPEVFYRIVSRNGRGGATPIDAMLAKLQVPLLLLWGEKDPWMVSALGDKAQDCAKACGVDVRRVSIDAGHCPQDEAPEAVNKGLIDFANELNLASV